MQTINPKPYRQMKTIISFVACLVLTACVSVDGWIDEGKVLEQSKNCCDSLSALPFGDLQLGQLLPVSISTSSPAFEFDEGKSYFAAFHLPAHFVGKKILVQTFIVNQTSSTYLDQVFIPHLTFLNAAFKPIRKISLNMQGNSALFREMHWEEAVQILPSDAYVVIHTGKEERIKTLHIPDLSGGLLAYLPRIDGMVVGNPPGYRTVPPGPTGKLKVGIGIEEK